MSERLTAKDVERMLAHVGRGRLATRQAAMITLMWRCGLRGKEVIGMRLRDIDQLGHAITVTGKRGRRRTLGLDRRSLVEIERWLEVRARLVGASASGHLFCSVPMGRALNSSYIRAMVGRIARRAGVTARAHPHALRHLFALQLSDEGVSLPLIRDALGHTSIATTHHYLVRLGVGEVAAMMRSRDSDAEDASEPKRLGRGSAAP